MKQSTADVGFEVVAYASNWLRKTPPGNRALYALAKPLYDGKDGYAYCALGAYARNVKQVYDIALLGFIQGDYTKFLFPDLMGDMPEWDRLALGLVLSEVIFASDNNLFTDKDIDDWLSHLNYQLRHFANRTAVEPA